MIPDGTDDLRSPLHGQAGPRSPTLHIIHFNDVYNVEEQANEPVAGAARFKTAIDSFSDYKPLILFSGDIFAPSIMSSFTKGEQMVPVMNLLGVHCSVYGNHDFDFGLERLVDMASRTKFPWLMSNVIDNETGKPLADGKVTEIIFWEGWTIGLMGLVEYEWLDTLATINSEQVTFNDYVEVGNRLSAELRSQGCDLVIALTHMRSPNDIKLAEGVDDIDIILGGHDHVYELLHINSKYIVKSGTDFRQFSHIQISISDAKKVEVDIEAVDVTSKYEPDTSIQEALHQYESVVSGKMEEILGNFTVELDGRFQSIRTSETNLGNFICDIMMAACNADLAILNSGTLRSDRLHSTGEFSMGELMSVLPMLDPLCVLEVTGSVLLEILENGVSQYPKLEGRFPQVAGLEFVFDSKAEAGSRVYKDLVKIGDEYLNVTQKYRMCTKAYMRQGRDGYSMLVDCPVLQDDEQCPMLSTAVQNHFTAINAKQSKSRRPSSHRQSLVLISRRHSLIRDDTSRPFSTRSVSMDGSSVRKKLSRQESVQDLEDRACKLHPTVEGRILCVSDQSEIEKLRQNKTSLADVSVIAEEDENSLSPKSSPSHGVTG